MEAAIKKATAFVVKYLNAVDQNNFEGFFADDSVFTRGDGADDGVSATGAEAIVSSLASFQYVEIQAGSVDAQVLPYNEIFAVFTGSLRVTENDALRSFSQSFVLAPRSAGKSALYIKNLIFRILGNTVEETEAAPAVVETIVAAPVVSVPAVVVEAVVEVVPEPVVAVAAPEPAPVVVEAPVVAAVAASPETNNTETAAPATTTTAATTESRSKGRYAAGQRPAKKAAAPTAEKPVAEKPVVPEKPKTWANMVAAAAPVVATPAPAPAPKSRQNTRVAAPTPAATESTETKPAEQEDTASIYVKGLDKKMTKEEVLAFFAKYGTIIGSNTSHVSTDGSCHIDFSTIEEAKTVEKLSLTTPSGKKLTIVNSRPLKARNFKPKAEKTDKPATDSSEKKSSPKKSAAPKSKPSEEGTTTAASATKTSKPSRGGNKPAAAPAASK